MKRLKQIVLLLSLSMLHPVSGAQTIDIDSAYRRSSQLYNSGDIIEAEKCLLRITDFKDQISNRYEVFCFTNLGVVNTMLGNYNKALSYYDLAEKSIYTKTDSDFYLTDIYVNKAIIYGYREQYQEAADFFEKGIRNYSDIKDPDRRIIYNLSTAFLNYGIILYETGKFNEALEYLNRSREMKINNRLPETALVEFNIAKTFDKLSDFEKAGEYFKHSIDMLIKENGQDYYRLAELYLEYGRFLTVRGLPGKSLEILNRALAICRKNYGEKHPLTSRAYKLNGDHYMKGNDPDSALAYYQRSLISIVRDFNDPAVSANPTADSSLHDLRLIDNLKSKALTLELLYSVQNDREIRIKTLEKSLETIGLCLTVIDRLRNSYPSPESRLYLAENEKETWFSAVKMANKLYDLTGADSLVRKMYSYVVRSKASVLQNEIVENNLLSSYPGADSLAEKQRILIKSITAYRKMVMEESLLPEPDSNKMKIWKDAIFEMSLSVQKISEEINTGFPFYRDLLYRTEPVPVSEILKKPGRDEAIVDYMISGSNQEEERELYIFVIRRKMIDFRKVSLDSAFTENIQIIRKGDAPSAAGPDGRTTFLKYTEALCYMYETIFKPVEELISGRRVIIVPDEEIAWVPFDALLKEPPDPDRDDYENLRYLVYDYSFTCAYSSALIFSGSGGKKIFRKVHTFTPAYSDNPMDIYAGRLKGAEQETGSIRKWFRGKDFAGINATEKGFREILGDNAVLHLAMHLVSDTVNSKYSYLLFSGGSDNTEDGKLYNYEISLMRIISPMVVLSACNSGRGTLYRSEGQMSLARSFILAGASSVVRTSWEVNDEVSAKIISRFYRNLSKGMSAGEAMRLARTEFIRMNPPVYSNPYYWASYEVTGGNDPVTYGTGLFTAIVVVIVILSAGFAVYYLRRRRILPALAE